MTHDYDDGEVFLTTNHRYTVESHKTSSRNSGHCLAKSFEILSAIPQHRIVRFITKLSGDSFGSGDFVGYMRKLAITVSAITGFECTVL